MKMTMMRRLVTPVLLLALLTLPVVAEDLVRGKPEEVGVSSTRLQRLTDAMQAYVQQGRLAGGVALVARRGKVVYLEAFGQRDREAKSPMKTDSMFRIASQSKAIVSVSVITIEISSANTTSARSKPCSIDVNAMNGAMAE